MCLPWRCKFCSVTGSSGHLPIILFPEPTSMGSGRLRKGPHRVQIYALCSQSSHPLAQKTLISTKKCGSPPRAILGKIPKYQYVPHGGRRNHILNSDAREVGNHGAMWITGTFKFISPRSLTPSPPKKKTVLIFYQMANFFSPA